jgi:hypothetical protein
MKTIALSRGRVISQKRENKLQWLRAKTVSEFFPFKTWFIVTVILPAMISSTIIFKAQASLEDIVELYFVSLVGSALLSFPVLIVGCTLYWCFQKLPIALLASRIFFLFILTIAILAEVIFLQGKEIVGVAFSDVSFYVAVFSIFIPGLAQVFKPVD